LVTGRVGEEVFDLLQFLDGLVGARHVGEGGLRHVLAQLFGLGLAEVEHPVTATLDVVHHPQQQEQQQTQRDEIDQDLEEQGLLGDLGVPAVGRLGIAQCLGDLVSALLGVLGHHLGALDARNRVIQGQP